MPEVRRRGTYELLAVIGALAYLSLPPAFAVWPGLYSGIARVAPLDGQRLANLRALMFVVSPIGLIYLFAVWRRATSLTDLTVLWRLGWVAPWIVLNVAIGALEPGGALFIASVDVLLPLAALAVERGAVVSRVVAHFRQPAPTPVHAALAWEGALGVLAIAVAGVWTARTSDAYVASFVIGVVGCYALFLVWASRSDDAATMAFAVSIRLILAGAAAGAIAVGYPPAVLTAVLAVLIGGAVASGYSWLWYRYVRVEGAISPTSWMIAGGLLIIGVSLVWSIGGPWYGETCQVLAFNIHRQDLIVGMFAVLVGLLIVDVSTAAPWHARAVSWLLPLAAVWFTSETKLLCHIGAGTPFHPSWTERGLAPVWSGNVVVDLTFSLATMALTAIGTTYTVAVCLRWTPRSGWRAVSWHGVAIMLVSALWMIATSTGVPALVPAMAGAALPPLLPGDKVACVQVHVADLVIGMFFIAGGLLMEARQRGLGALVPFVVGAGWALTLIPKLLVHLGLP